QAGRDRGVPQGGRLSAAIAGHHRRVSGSLRPWACASLPRDGVGDHEGAGRRVVVLIETVRAIGGGLERPIEGSDLTPWPLQWQGDAMGRQRGCVHVTVFLWPFRSWREFIVTLRRGGGCAPRRPRGARMTSSGSSVGGGDGRFEVYETREFRQAVPAEARIEK